MASRSIAREIKCEHSNECKSYSAWIGDGKFSKCVNCRNNKYQNPERMKKDFIGYLQGMLTNRQSEMERMLEIVDENKEDKSKEE